MKRLFLMIGVLVLASVGVWGQQITSTTLPSGVTWTGLGADITLVNSASLDNCAIMSVNQKGDHLEVITRCQSHVLYATNPMTSPTGRVTKEIYGVQDGKIALLRTVNARVIAAQAERIEWPDVQKGDGGSAGNTGTVTYKKYAHAQQQPPKEVASAATPPKAVGPIDIPFPADEAKMMSDLKTQKDRLGTEFKVAEGQKELDKLKEIYDAGVAAVQKKYSEYSKRVEPLVRQEQLVLQLSAIKLGLTEEQTVGPKRWLPQTDEKGVWVWRKPLEQARTQ